MPVLRVSHSAVVEEWRGREGASATRRRAAGFWAESGLGHERQHQQEPLQTAGRAG